MKERKAHTKKGIISVLFLLIIGGLMVNSSFFLHAHKNESGKIIFHAHPFDKGAEQEDPLAKHQHKKIDLNYLNIFDHYLFVPVYIDLDINRDVELEVLSKPCLLHSSKIISIITARGPPQESYSA